MQKNLSFDEMDNYGGSGKRIPFFGLKDDGDRAMVRIYHENGDDIQKLPVHTISVGERKLKVLCLRNPGDNEDECPLCASGSLVSPRMFIKLLVYTPDKSGFYTGKPTLQIWERGRSFRKQLQSLINRYASNKPLMDTVFEIERCGKAGDTQTTYQFYKAELEPDECPLPGPDEINDVDAVGTLVAEKSFEDLQIYVETGNLPKSESTESSRTRNASARSERAAETEPESTEYPTGRRASGVRTVEDSNPNREMRRPSRRV